jgi:glycosyltransferase involved in cell wall biosynthesis
MNLDNKIVIINQDAGYLMIDIANRFVSAGYSVTFISGRIVERDVKLDKSILVRKISKYNRFSVIKRLYTWISAFIGILKAIKKYHRHDELLLVSNPPIALFIPLFCKNKFNFLIFDVYVDTLQKFVPLKSKSPFVFIWKKMHKFVLNRAKSIFVLTDGMKNTLIPYCKSVEINILPLWTDNPNLKHIERNENSFIKEHKLEGFFIVFYSGNLGLTSGVENIIELAVLLKNDLRIKFLIVGEGLQKEKIKAQIAESSLTNCLLLPRQSYQTMPYSFASADISIVSLSGHSSNNSIPSKTFNYLSAGSPILCLANETADIAKFVEHWNVGKVFSSDKLRDAATFLKNLPDNLFMLAEMKSNALKAALNSSPENANILVKYIAEN